MLGSGEAAATPAVVGGVQTAAEADPAEGPCSTMPPANVSQQPQSSLATSQRDTYITAPSRLARGSSGGHSGEQDEYLLRLLGKGPPRPLPTVTGLPSASLGATAGVPAGVAAAAAGVAAAGAAAATQPQASGGFRAPDPRPPASTAAVGAAGAAAGTAMQQAGGKPPRVVRFPVLPPVAVAVPTLPTAVPASAAAQPVALPASPAAQPATASVPQVQAATTAPTPPATATGVTPPHAPQAHHRHHAPHHHAVRHTSPLTRPTSDSREQAAASSTGDLYARTRERLGEETTASVRSAIVAQQVQFVEQLYDMHRAMAIQRLLLLNCPEVQQVRWVGGGVCVPAAAILRPCYRCAAA